MKPPGLAMTSRPTAFGRYLNTKVATTFIHALVLTDKNREYQFLNVAAKHNGGSAQAAYSQVIFHSNLSGTI
jgi:hypothetical protein